MSWFSRNFGKREGGSTGGNLLRRVTKAAVRSMTLGIWDGTNSDGSMFYDGWIPDRD